MQEESYKHQIDRLKATFGGMKILKEISFQKMLHYKVEKPLKKEQIYLPI